MVVCNIDFSSLWKTVNKKIKKCLKIPPTDAICGTGVTNLISIIMPDGHSNRAREEVMKSFSAENSLRDINIM